MKSQHTPIPLDAAGVPELLKQKDAWVNWRAVERDGRVTKVPCMPTGASASSTNPATWSSFEAVKGADGFSGVGIMLIDDLVGIDLDKCLNQSGELEPWAQKVVDMFPRSYIERSPSGRGLHILCLGAPERNGKGGPENRLELYSKASPRYFTVTGSVYQFGGLLECQEALDTLVDEFLPGPDRDKRQRSVATTESRQAKPDDQAIITKACRLNARFRRLWSGEDLFGDDSSNDMSLCNHLCFWLGRDRARVDAAFRRSGLMRPKWDEMRGQQTYGELTIDKALQSVFDSYRPGGATEPALRAKEEGRRVRQNKPLVIPVDFSKPITAPETLIQKYLPRDGIGMVWGDPSSYKSFLAIDWSLRVATGTPWNNCKISKGVVWYLAGEGVAGLRRRVDAWLKHNKKQSTDVADRFFLPGAPIVFNESDGDRSEQVELLAELVLDGKGPDLVIVDTVARSMSGDENTVKDVGGFIRAVDYLVELVRSTGRQLCVVLIHHARKSSDDYRGSSAFRGAMDFEYRLSRKGLSQVELSCSKMKDLEIPKSVRLERRVVDLGCQVDNHGDLLGITSLVLDVADEAISIASVGGEEQLAYLLVQDATQAAWVAGEPIRSQKDLEDGLCSKVSRASIRAAFDSRNKSGWMHKIVIDRAVYELVDKRRGCYYVALKYEEQSEFLATGKLPDWVFIPPVSMAQPWGEVPEGALREAAAAMRQKREKAAANEVARLQLIAEASAKLKANSNQGEGGPAAP
jgi:putative DNA primase/helicase